MGTQPVRLKGLVQRGSTFYFRLDLPADVRSLLGRTAVWESLGTSDRAVAIEKWGALNATWRERIRQARDGSLRSVTDAQVWEVGIFLLEHAGADYKGTGPLTLSYISQTVDAGLSEHDRYVDDDGRWIDFVKLTQADKRAIVDSVADTLFRRLTGAADQAQLNARQLLDWAKPITPATAAKVPKLIDAFDGWKSATKPRPKTAHEFRTSIDMFIGVNGDLPLSDLTADHFRTYRAHLRTLKSARGSLLAVGTAHKRFTAIKAIISNAVDEGLLQANPGQDVTIERGKSSGARRQGWSDEELATLFGSAIYANGERPVALGGEAAYWIPVLALYTGARQSELCQLGMSEIVTVSGIKCFRLSDDDDEQHLKTEQSYRLVPISEAIWRLGFDKYLATLDPKGKLFPLVKGDAHGVAGGQYSKAFGKLRRDLGLIRPGSDFHALRHMAKTAIRSVDGDFESKAALTGHDTGNESAAYGSVPVKDLKRIVDQVEFAIAIPNWKAGRIIGKKRGRGKRRAA